MTDGGSAMLRIALTVLGVVGAVLAVGYLFLMVAMMGFS